jgi:hypothetical protein
VRGAVQEAGAAVVGPERRQRVRALRAREVAPVEHLAAQLQGPLHLPALAQQVAEHLQHLDRLGRLARDRRELDDRLVRLPGAQVVEPSR